MKKTEQSFNSTLKSCSYKRAQEERQYAKVCEQLKELAQGVSEYSNLKTACWPLECHHIWGRVGALLLDPFNILCCKRSEHETIHEHNTREQKFELAETVRKIRISQGFKYTGEFTAKLEV